jgi:hypothetical protein
MIKLPTLMNLVELTFWVLLLTLLGVWWAKADTWEDMGRALNERGYRVQKHCYASTGVCTYAIHWAASDGTKLMMVEVEESGGKITTRYLCRFINEDRRRCINWDTQEPREEIYDRGNETWAPAR